jgi:hypothetical protein
LHARCGRKEVFNSRVGGIRVGKAQAHHEPAVIGEKRRANGGCCTLVAARPESDESSPGSGQLFHYLAPLCS